MFKDFLGMLGSASPAVPFGPASDGADAGGGGGPAAGADAGAGPAAGATGADPAADDGDAVARAAAEAEAGADDRDDLPDDDDLVEHLPEPQLRTRLRRTQRFAQKVRPLADRLRGPDGKFLTPEQVDRVLSNARYFEEVDGILQRDPEAVRALQAARARLEAGATEPEPADEPFNEADWPYETESAQGKRLLQMAKDQHEDRQRMRRLERQLAGVDRRDQLRTVEQAESQWKTAALTAAKEVDAEYRPMFVRAVRAEFELLKAQNMLTKASAQSVIDRHLAPIRARNKGKTRETVDRQSAMAAANGKLPAVPRPGAMRPAAGGGEPKRETLKDASKSFLARYAH